MAGFHWEIQLSFNVLNRIPIQSQSSSFTKRTPLSSIRSEKTSYLDPALAALPLSRAISVSLTLSQALYQSRLLSISRSAPEVCFGLGSGRLYQDPRSGGPGPLTATMVPLVVLLLSLISAPQLGHAEQPAEEEPVSVRQVQQLGGWFERSVDSEEVQEAVRSAMEDFNKKSKARKYFRLINVTSAETQVTNKINYRIQATVGKTKCVKTEMSDIESCVLARKRLTCKFEVRFDPRTNTHEVVSSSCQKQPAA